jgi:hypothetical protein
MMKKILITIFYFLLVSQQLSAQIVHWEKILDETYINDLEITSNGNMFACRQSLQGVLISSDEGNSWTQDTTINTSIHNIAIDETDNIYLGSRYGYPAIFKSSDYGNNWVVLCSLGFKVTALHVSKKGSIYAGGADGKFLSSVDSGKTWATSTITDKKIISITTASEETIFICTEYGPMFSSSDSGKTWIELIHPSNAYSAQNALLDGNDILYTARGPTIGISSDFGLTWSITGNISGDVTPGVLGQDSTNIYVGYNSIYQSSDSGVNWNHMGGPSRGITSINPFHDKIYIASNGGVYKYDPSIPLYVGSNYFPMQVGNADQFILKTKGSGGVQNYYLINHIIEKDTLINAYNYFLYDSEWLRYSEEEKKIFIWHNDSDKIYMDFNLPALATFQQFSDNKYKTAATFEGEKTIFGNTFKYKGYYTKPADFTEYRYERSFGENMGIFFYGSFNSGAGPRFESISDLIMKIIYDSTGTPNYYSHNYKPVISLTPKLITNSNLFHLNFSVNHHYSKFFSLETPHKGINFIDSVYMLGYYSKASIILIDTIHAVNKAKTNEYTITASLDTLLLKDGYTFNYKIIAVDKGIIPEISSSPDSGYHECVWGNTTSIKEIDDLSLNFNLYQNYPNPFNPTTKIKFTIPTSPQTPLLTKERGRGEVVTLKVYDVLGNEVATLVNETKSPGEYEVEFDGSSLSSGIYFYQLKSGSYIQINKMVLIK